MSNARPDSDHVLWVMDASAEYVSKSLPCMLGNPRILHKCQSHYVSEGSELPTGGLVLFNRSS